MAALSSRERMLTALDLQEPDRVPVTFWGQVAPLAHLGSDLFERVLRLRELGADDCLRLGHPQGRHPAVPISVTTDPLILTIPA